MERSQLRNTEFVALDSVTVNVDKTDEAVAKVKIRDKYTGVDFALQVLLERQSDGHWSVVALENYRDYLSVVTSLQIAAITAYIEATQPVVDEYNDRFLDQRTRFETSSGKGAP